MSEDAPFRILVIGDLGPDGGTGTRIGVERRRPRRVDRDDLDRVLHALGPRLVIPNMGGHPDVLDFHTMEDFDAERVAQRAPSTAAMLVLRDRLAHPSTFEQAARDAGLVIDGEGDAADVPASEQDTAPPGSISLEDVLAVSEVKEESKDEWGSFARDLVRDEVDRIRVPGKPPGQDACVAAVELALQARLRQILRDPAFRALEAAWRGVKLLTRRLATDTQLTLHVLDVGREELGADIGVSGDMDGSMLFRRLVEETVGTTEGDPWSLVVGLYEFAATPQDVAVLLRVGRLAAAAKAPFVSGAQRVLVGCAPPADVADEDTWADATDPVAEQLWAALRSTPESSAVGLMWPRFLLRAPRGEATSPVEGFPFEEVDAEELGDVLTWGNGALVAALLLGEAFSRAGWDLRRELAADVENLPAVIREVDGERELVPCGEIMLRGRALERVTSLGLIPILSHAGNAAVRLGGLHSLSATGSELAGRWL